MHFRHLFSPGATQLGAPRTIHSLIALIAYCSALIASRPPNSVMSTSDLLVGVATNVWVPASTPSSLVACMVK